jgi:soluble P-type ATPase
MKYFPKGCQEYELNTIVLDLNGTLSVNGKLVDGVVERIGKLKELGYKIYLFSGDIRGTAADIAKALDIELKYASTTYEKDKLSRDLNFDSTVAIGNARIDIGTFKNAKVSIATLQGEGIHFGVLNNVDILVSSINDALDLLIEPKIFEATMRM